MSKFVRFIGRCSMNNNAVALYENTSGSFTLKPERFAHPLPKRFWKNFETEEQVDQYIERFNKTGPALVLCLYQHMTQHESAQAFQSPEEVSEIFDNE